MAKLSNTVCIVTGAASGIGRSIAQLFAKEGAQLVLADCQKDLLETLTQEITSSGGEAHAEIVDVSSQRDMEKMVAAAIATFGRINVLVNNAGIEGEQAPTADCTVENFDRVIAVNLRSVFLGMKYAIPHLLKAGGGSIINVGSVASVVGFPNIPAYCASKGGVLQLTRTAALEYAKQNIRVNAICPGVIMTPMIERFIGGNAETRKGFEAIEPVGRFGTPDEVAQLALFLASADSSFCTGAPFMVDGGMVAA